jgi:hypothetical protein
MITSPGKIKEPMRAKTLLLALLLSIPGKAERSLDLNFGLAPTKSVLGLSYTVNETQLNAGIKGFWVGSRGYLLQPGIGINRYFTSNGFYGSLSYAPVYLNEEAVRLRSVGPGPNDYVLERYRDKGWKAGITFLGAGKSFQFTRWGLHLDGGFVTPADADFARSWGYWIGAGGSYRFKLD